MSVPGFGESVGDAYVRIFADGSRLPGSIKDEVRNADKDWGEAGRRGGSKYHEGFDKEMRRQEKNPNSSLFRQLGRFDATSQKLGGDYGQKLRRSIIAGLGKNQAGRDEIADRIFANLREQAFSAGTTKVIKNQLKDFSRLRAQAIRDLQRDEGIQRGIRRREEADERGRVKLAAAAERTLMKLRSDRSAALERAGIRDVRRDRHLLDDRIKNALADARLGYHETTSLLSNSIRDFNRHVGEGNVKVTGFFRRSLRELTPFERRFARLGGEVDKLGDKVGRGFGKGSRNNFFNALGRSVEGLFHITVGLVPKIITLMGELGGEFSQAFKEGEGFFGKLANIADVALQNIEQGLSFLIKSAIGAAGALGLLYTVGGLIVSALSAASGVIVALASSIGFALVGAAGAAVPLLLPLAAAVGVVTLAFSKLSKEQKKALAADFKPVTSQFRDLQKVAQKGLFSNVKQQAKLLAPVIRDSLKPLVAGEAKAVSGVGTIFIKTLAGPDMKKFFKVLSKDLPGMTLKLGHVFGNTLRGIGGEFRALLPFANKLLDSLVKGSAHFAKFANSASGQNRIKKFMDNAWESAKKLMTTLRLTFRVLKDIFGAGRTTGNGFLDSINSSLNRLDLFLKSPRGQRGLKSFFDQATQLTHALGPALGGIGKLFAGLNGQAAHNILDGTLKTLGALGGALGNLLEAIGNFLEKVGPQFIPLLHTAAKLLTGLINFAASHGDVFGPLTASVLGLWLAFKGARAISDISGAVAARLANIRIAMQGGISGIVTQVGRFQTAMAGIGVGVAGIAASRASGNSAVNHIGSTLSGAVGGALVGSAIEPGIGTAIGAVVGGLAGLASSFIGVGDASNKAGDRAQQALERQRRAAELAKTAVENLTGAIQADSLAIGANTKQQVVNDLSKNGALDIARKLNLNQKDIVDAQLGNASAQRRVNAAINFSGLTSGKNAQQGAKLLALLGLEKTAITGATRAADDQASALGRLHLGFRSVANQVAAYKNTLDLTTTAGQRNTRFISDRIGLLSKERAQGKLTATQYLSQVSGLRATLLQYKFNKTGVDNLIASLVKVPKKTLTKLLADPKIANSAIGDVIRRLLKVPNSKTTDLRGRNSVGAAVNRVLESLSLLPGHRDVTIGANVQFAISEMARVQRSIDKLTGGHVDIGISGRGTAGMASGGILTAARRILAGEDGPEAIVPLRRNLNRVDPSVRWLSAIAQGKGAPDKFASGGVVGGGKTITIAAGAIQVITPTDNPAAVAQELLNRIVAQGY